MYDLWSNLIGYPHHPDLSGPQVISWYTNVVQHSVKDLWWVICWSQGLLIKPCSFQYSPMQTLPILVSSDSQLCLFNSGMMLVPANFSFFFHILRTSLSSKGGQLQVHFIFFSSFSVHCVLLPAVQCLENHCVIILSGFLVVSAGRVI